MPSLPDASNGGNRSSPLLWRILKFFLRSFRGPVDRFRRASRAAAYPIQGIYYFLRHPEFYPVFLGRLLPLSIISFLVYLILFTFAFIPQLLFLMIFQGKAGAWFNAIVLVLGEGHVVIQGLFEGFFVDEAQVDIFDATLINHGLTDLVAPHRLLFPDAPTSVKMLGKPTTKAEFQPFSLKQIIELIVFLPFNLIPYGGTVAFLMITGSRYGKLSHHRWFQLRGLSKKEMKRERSYWSWEYTWFGTIAMVLQLIPVLSFFFLLTTSAGAALWVTDLEERSRVRVGRPVTANDQAARNQPDEPVYHDGIYHDDPV
ncbi:hypothetical protein N0V85_006188 [Neurospora sp. IMI 360204]|nr:hypothetical protein N0V85_006188 [Neurospora sp. IMI 360204]